MTYESLRKKHKTFTYESYDYYVYKKDLIINFVFTLSPGIRFEPKVIIKNIDEKRVRNFDSEVLDTFVFHLGLAEIPSYWKSAVSPQIIIKAGYLSQSQIAWWHDLLEHGLGEFFYRNQIPFSKKFLHIKSTVRPTPKNSPALHLKDRYLIPMGGGKDSLVTAHLFKQARKNFRPLILGDVPAAKNASRFISSLPPISVERKIDTQLMSLNKKGYLNGHTPFSSYLAFLTVFTAVLFDYRSVAISQERSSNEGNVLVGKKVINHQYSKSYTFEKKFREYLRENLSSEINFFSFLRPLSELQIAKIFSRTSKYFPVFKSCNVNLKQNSWCGNCAKCFTIFLLLAPFLTEKELVRIFKKNLLENPSLWTYIPAFLGKSKERPFDCIASKEETEVALSLAAEKYAANKKQTPLLLDRYLKIFQNQKPNSARFLKSWDRKNFLPKELSYILRKNL